MSSFPIFVIFIFNLDANFPSLQPKFVCNLQTEITVSLCAPTLLLVHRSVVFKIFLFIFFQCWTISWDCEPITIHFSQYRDFGYLWFCEKLDEKLALLSSLTFRERRNAKWEKWSLILQETWRETCLIVLFDISWKYRSSGENGEMRKMVGKMVYKMPSVHFSFLSFCQHFFAFSSIWR